MIKLIVRLYLESHDTKCEWAHINIQQASGVELSADPTTFMLYADGKDRVEEECKL